MVGAKPEQIVAYGERFSVIIDPNVSASIFFDLENVKTQPVINFLTDYVGTLGAALEIAETIEASIKPSELLSLDIPNSTDYRIGVGPVGDIERIKAGYIPQYSISIQDK